MSRFTAFAIHLGISTGIFLALFALVWFVWYPDEYFATDGGWEGIRLIAAVDVVLGPLLTLIIFRAGKPGLRRDLTIIGIVQTLALSAGVWIVHSERPLLVVFAEDRFVTLNAAQVARAKHHAPAIIAQSERLPAYAYVRLPDDPAEMKKLLREALRQDQLPYLMGQRYERIGPSNVPAIWRYSLEVEKLTKDRPREQRRLEAFLRKHGGVAQDYVFVPLKARYALVLMAFSRTDQRLVGPVNVDASPVVSFF